MNILSRVCMNLKIHAYNLEKLLYAATELQFLLLRLRSRQNINIKSSMHEPENSCL